MRIPTLATLAAVVLLPTIAFAAASTPAAVPKTTAPASAARNDGDQTAVFAGGCFWGMEAVFERLRGVRSVEAGYTGGKATTAHYEVVSTGLTGHAESIFVRFDPKQISYRQLLDVYFGVAHDPTTKNRQGNDVGPQYRSEIFYASLDQRHVAEATIAKLDAAHAYPAPIVTELAPLGAFYPAEAYHQHYADLHPDDAYIRYVDEPKIAALDKQFASLERSALAKRS